MRRKKILWLCSWYPGKTNPFNGDFVQRHARAAALCNDIYVIHVTGDVSGRVKKKEKEIEKSTGLTEHIVSYPASASLFGRMKSHYQFLFIFKQAIRRYIVENGKPDLVHVQVPMKAGLLALWLKKRYKVPYIVTEHYGIYNKQIGRESFLYRSSVYKNYMRKIIKQASGFISVSQFLAEGVNNLVIKKEYRILPNSVDTSKFFYKPKNGPGFRFLHVSNMVPLKNAEGLLRAFKSFISDGGKAILVMAGNCDEDLPAYAASLGLSGNEVLFLGVIPYDQVVVEMQQSDCFVLFSNIENSPCVIGEALCSGLPVIATNVGGIPELINQENAILVGAGNEVELSLAMHKMAANYQEYDKKKIAENAAGKFSYPVVGKKMDEIYTEVLSLSVF